jgi:hypothetical protein
VGLLFRFSLLNAEKNRHKEHYEQKQAFLHRHHPFLKVVVEYATAREICGSIYFVDLVFHAK